LKRVNDEAGYVAKMLPLLLDHTKAKGNLPKLAPEMIDERAVSVGQLAVVMQQAAAVGSYGKADPRYEAGARSPSRSDAMVSWSTRADARRPSNSATDRSIRRTRSTPSRWMTVGSDRYTSSMPL